MKETIKVGINSNVIEMIFNASPVVQVTLFLLIILSIVCWAIVFSKIRELKKVRDANENFLAHFFGAPSLDEVSNSLTQYLDSPLAQVFKSGFGELQKLASSALAADGPEKDEATPKLRGIDNLTRALKKSSDIEMSSLERRLTFLATTSSTAPFIGLFGTVWGIMNAFQKIGATGSASLAIVAPGISEALIATAVGLAAAIPAAAAYNFFVSKLKYEEMEFENFTSDFLNIAKRNFFGTE